MRGVRVDRLDEVTRGQWNAARDRFELEAMTSAPESLQSGLRLLELTVELEDDAYWRSLVADGTLAKIEAAVGTPTELLEVLEMESYAPASSGVDAIARARLEDFGHANAMDDSIARAAERLLHAGGDAAAAYRVEHSRRAVAVSIRRPRTRSVASLRLDGQTIVVAGGHRALREGVRRDLMALGAAAVREVPSSKEANWDARDIQHAVDGATAVVMFVRQIAHSTSNHLRAAATKRRIPLLYAETTSLFGVRRTLEAWSTQSRRQHGST
jgi:hypothetical protein